MELETVKDKKVVERAGAQKVDDRSQLPLRQLPPCHAAGTFGYTLEVHVEEPGTAGPKKLDELQPFMMQFRPHMGEEAGTRCLVLHLHQPLTM